VKDCRINSGTQRLALALRRFKISLFNNINRYRPFKLLAHLVSCKAERTHLKAWCRLQVIQLKPKHKLGNQASTLSLLRKQPVPQPQASRLNANKLKTVKQLSKT